MAAVSERKATPLSALAGKFGRYVRSPSTRMAAFVGLLFYLSYAYAHGSWTNTALISVSVFIGVFIPSYAKLSNKAELWANNRISDSESKTTRSGCTLSNSSNILFVVSPSSRSEE